MYHRRAKLPSQTRYNFASIQPKAAYLAFNKSIATELQGKLTDPNFSLLEGSEQQRAIWEAMQRRTSHLIVRALAGTGKTTTGVQGLKRSNYENPKAATFHSVGFGAVRTAFGQVEVDQDRTWNMLPPYMASTKRRLVCKLVALAKNTLLSSEASDDEWLDMATLYDIDLYDDNGDLHSTQELLNTAKEILEKSKVPQGTIDFDDMIWLPVIHHLPIHKFDFLIVDESQDLNDCQIALALMIAKRIMVVGDEHQAIYGFRGANTSAIKDLTKALHNSELGVTTLPLTVSRRCPILVTALAREIVPEFECLPTAPFGRVCLGDSFLEPEVDVKLAGVHPGYCYKKILYPTKKMQEGAEIPGYCEDLEPQRGDMVICRTNAPLVQLAYDCIRKQIPVKIQGRDIGQGLTNLIKKLVPETSSVEVLAEKLHSHAQKETQRILRSAPSGSQRVQKQLEQLQDKLDCIFALMEGLTQVREVLARITLLFQDVQASDPDKSRFVLLSSVHRAKGLEAHTVRIIRPDLLPHPMAKLPWQQEQEWNLKYVAITRSLNTLHIH